MSTFDRTLRTIRRIARTRYPGFLFGLPLPEGEIPIFTYHEADPVELRRDLEFLKRNGYRTLSLDEFLERDGVAERGAREVLLTFDDARASVFRQGLPILQEYGARAVLFVPTFWVGGTLFMSWDEIRQCRDSGVFSIESHAHRHALVHTSSRLAGFADPNTLSHFDIYDWPMRNAGDQEELGFPPPGTPVYEAAPLLSAKQCYLESPEVVQACQALVARFGIRGFFSWRGAQAELRRFHDQQARRHPGRYMDERAFEALQVSEFELSRAAFMKHLGAAPRCLAFPWMVGSPRSLQYAKDTGIEAVFGAALDFRQANNPHLPVRVFGRFKSDWLRLLPGEQRTSLRETLGRKIAGFASHHNLAH